MKCKTVRVRIADLKRRPIRRDHGSAEDLKLLAASWLARPIHPIICRPDLTVADGNRRVEGLALLGESDVTVGVTEDDLSDAELIEIGVASATHREGLTGFDLVEAVRRYAELMPSMSGRAMADRFHVSESRLSVLRGIAACPKAFAALADGRAGHIKGAYQVACARPGAKDEVIKLLAAGGTADQAAASRKKPAAPAVKQARTVVPLPSGLRVQVSGPEIDLPQLIDALLAALDAARKASRDHLDIRTFAKVAADKARAGG